MPANRIAKKEIDVLPMTSLLARDVAQLHVDGISSGFISSLGLNFTEQLYRGIVACPLAFCIVALHHGRVFGFIAGAESVGKLYRSVIFRRGLLMIGPLLRFVLSPSTIRKVFQTLLYPKRISANYPTAEILSVVVASEARQKGIGHMLMTAACEEFSRREIHAIKVAVGAENRPANEYYLRHGFEKAGMYNSHGIMTNILVRKL